ncbi:hypothetical protein OJ610_09730, partial [Streptococcus anginosus]|nr:hypothetical protein [Streptococcus anginosus]
RTAVATALEADKSGNTLTWAACPTETAALAGVTGLKVSTGTLASTATGTLPVSVIANSVGDVNTSFTAGVFTTTGDGKVEFSEATPLSVYVREPAPADTVTEGEWEDATDQNAKNCDTKQVTQTRTVTTTPHKWDSGKRQWVLDTSKASKKTETRQRDMNDGEHRACSPQPPAQVTATNWVDGAKDCNTRKVSQSRTVTTTPYKWDSGKRKWVLDTAKASKKTETRQRDMNDGEHRECTPQPPAQVTATNWADGAKDCNTRKVSQSRTVTTTPYK